MESEYCLDIFYLILSFLLLLLVNFVSCHSVLEYEIKYVANFVNISLPR